MKRFFIKPYRWAIFYSSLLSIAAAFVLLDTFVIPKAITTVSVSAAVDKESSAASAAVAEIEQTVASPAVVTDSSYEDENIKIAIETGRSNNTTYYAVDIQLADASYLQTALAEDTFGRNIKAATSTIADSHQAILAINGDYYGFRDQGYVLRNGVIYRDTARDADSDDALVIDNNGDFSIISENETSLASLDTTEHRANHLVWPFVGGKW